MIKVQNCSLLSRQIKELNKNGVYPIETRTRANMIVVRAEDLEKATKLKISNDITVARRA